MIALLTYTLPHRQMGERCKKKKEKERVDQLHPSNKPLWTLPPSQVVIFLDALAAFEFVRVPVTVHYQSTFSKLQRTHYSQWWSQCASIRFP